MKVEISPWHPNMGTGYVCLPLKRNIKTGHKDWKLVKCPECGSDCWESDLARELLAHEQVVGICTQYALQRGIGGVRGGKNEV